MRELLPAQMISGREGMVCPVERCTANTGGYCNARARQLRGLAPATLFPLGLQSYIGGNALGVAGGYFFSDMKDDHRREYPADDQIWQNCPQYKKISRRS